MGFLLVIALDTQKGRYNLDMKLLMIMCSQRILEQAGEVETTLRGFLPFSPTGKEKQEF